MWKSKNRMVVIIIISVMKPPIHKIRMILDKMQSAFPEASLKAFINGEKISLKKALKTISK